MFADTIKSAAAMMVTVVVLVDAILRRTYASNQIKYYFIVRSKVDQRAGQLCLSHVEITKTEKIELKRQTDEQISPVNGLEPRDQSDRQKQT